MKTFTSFLILGTTLFTSARLHAQSEGPLYPSSTDNEPFTYCTVCAGAIWNNPTNVWENDGLYSDVQLQPYLNCYESSCYRSRYLTCYNFGFDIPCSAEIKGIEVDVYGFCDMPSVVLDCTIVLRQNSISLSGNNQSNLTPWSTTPGERSYGGPTELWGVNWTPSDINSCDFGTYIKVYNPTTFSPVINVDCVSMTVTYELTTGIYSQTSSPQPLKIFTGNVPDVLDVSFEMPPGTSNALLDLYDATGHKCYSATLEGMPGYRVEEQLETDLASGIYFCTVYTERKKFTQKIYLGN
jgi:hypothetical protein